METDILHIMKFVRKTVKFAMTKQALNTGTNEPLEPGETVLILIDNETEPAIWKAYFIALQEQSVEPVIMMMSRRNHDYANPPKLVVKAMEKADSIMYLTTTGLVHSQTGQKMSKLKKKNFHGEHLTIDMMTRGWRWFDEDVIADWQSWNRKLREATIGGKLIHITTPRGTDLTIEVGDRPHMGTPGSSAFLFKVCNLVPSEVHLGLPNQNAGNGVIVGDMSIHHIGALHDPIKFTLENGKIIKIDGGPEAVEFEKWLEDFGDEGAWILGEIAMGTNKWTRFTGNLREDRKIWGTCHLGFGQNVDVGGLTQSKIHWDVVLSQPTISVDGRKIVVDGKILL